MNDAFSRVHRFLNFAPYPVWLYEDVPLAYGDGVEGLAVRLSSGYVQTIGKRITTAIQSNATVTYSDEDGDGVEDTATITVATAVDVSEIAVFFRTADGAPESANDAWRVQPLTMRASGGNVTITGHKSLFVNPSAVWDTPYSNPNYDERQAGDTGTAGHFVTTVDVYRVHADTTDAVVIMGCDGGDESVSATIVNAQEGVIRLSGTSGCAGDPYVLRVYYLAGYPLDDGRMVDDLAGALVHLANAEMAYKPGGLCAPDVAPFTPDREEVGQFREDELEKGFGTTRGAIDAYRKVEPWRAKCGNTIEPRWIFQENTLA